MFYISGHMETFDTVHSYREEDVQLLDSLLDDDMCNELYNGEFDSSRDWLDCLMQDDNSCLVEDCMLISGVGTSLSQPSPPVNSEHSYSLAVDLSQSAPDVAAKLDDYVDCDLDVMNAVNPNLAMTSCSSHDTENDDNIYTMCYDELNQTDDVKSDTFLWDENNVDESEPIVLSDVDQSVQLLADSDQSEQQSDVGIASPTAVVVTCTRKLAHQQPTIIVTRAHPTSALVTRVSKAGVLSKIKPSTLPTDGSSGLVLKNSVVIVSSPEHCLVSDSDNVEQLPPTPPGSCSGDSDESRSPKGSAPSSPQQQRLAWHQSPVTYYSSLQPSATVPGSGMLILTDEEKRTLIAEGYPVPTRWPLSKQDEKNLKKVQRKIKNKMSAQESRRKKKDYVDSLEKQLEASNHENSQLKQKMENLESDNRALTQKLQKLQSLANSVAPSSPPQASTCLMLFVLFFAVSLGVWSPASLSQQLSWRLPLSQSPAAAVTSDQAVSDYNTPSVKSRTLFSFADDPDGSTLDTSSSCGYHNALLSWLTGRLVRSQQTEAAWLIDHDKPSDTDVSSVGAEQRETLIGDDQPRSRVINVTIQPPTSQALDETWITTTLSHSTQLNVTYTAVA